MSGKYNSNQHRKWTRFNNLPSGKELGLDKCHWLLNVEGQPHAIYNISPYTGYFDFCIDEDGTCISAMKFDHDEGYYYENESYTLFEYEGNNLEEWETGVEEFERHQKEWGKWKNFVKEYNKFYQIK